MKYYAVTIMYMKNNSLNYGLFHVQTDDNELLNVRKLLNQMEEVIDGENTIPICCIETTKESYEMSRKWK